MKTAALFLFLVFTPGLAYAQIKFEKGYLIDSAYQRIDCLIKNVDWAYSPKEIFYKLAEEEEIEAIDLKYIRELVITDKGKYIVAEVEIDQSPMQLDKLSKSRDPEFKKECVLLKVLVEGKSSLYYYSQNSFYRFFFKTADMPIQQLVFKEYVKDDWNIATNFLFRQQLWSYVKCEKSKSSVVNNISYNQTELIKYFTEYNVCTDSSYSTERQKPIREIVNFKIISGLDYTSLSILSSVFSQWNSYYPDKVNIRIGLETEIILPFNRNKWGVFIEPSYFSFTGSDEIMGGSASIDYESIEFPIGIRHYFNLNDHTKIFLTAQYIPAFNIDLNSTIRIYSTFYNVNPLQSYSFGGGVCFKRMSAGIRYYPNRDLLGDFVTWSTDYQRLSFLFSYKFIGIRTKPD